MINMCDGIVTTLGLDRFCAEGYAREVPYGCVDQGLLSILYFLPGQAMAPHRHMDSDEYFTAVYGQADMIVNGLRKPLAWGETFLRRRGTLHALRNPGPDRLVVQSFQVPIPQHEWIVWESVEGWESSAVGCVRCWCGQTAEGRCVNCDAARDSTPLMPDSGAEHDRPLLAADPDAAGDASRLGAEGSRTLAVSPTDSSS